MWMRLFAIFCLFSLSLAVPAHVSGYVFEGIPILPKVFDPPYERDLYKHWIDADGDHEDTRQEVLIEESLIPATIRTKSNGRRKVVDGLWVSPFTGFVTTDPKKLQIDHMIPLKEVHISGGHAWDAKKRKAYANDLDHSQALIAVKGGANQSKGARDPAHWMPPNRSYWCQYLADWVAVKKKWGLAMDIKEVDAIKKGRKVCKKYKSGDTLEGRH